MSVHSAMRLSFSDRESEMGPCLQRLREDPSEHLVIALKPAVRAAFKQKGISVQSTLPYFQNVSHARALETSKLLVEWLRKHAEFRDPALGIREAYREALIFRTRLIIHYCIWVIEIVLNAVERHLPVTLCASLSGQKPASCYCIEPEENCVGRLVEEIARQKRLGFDDLGRGSSRPLSDSGNQLAYRTRPLIRFVLQHQTFPLWATWNGRKSRLTGKDLILLTTRLYQMNKLAEQLKAEHPERLFDFLEGPIIPSGTIPDVIIRALWKKHAGAMISQKRLLKDLSNAVGRETELFAYRGISFAEIVAEKISAPIADHLIGLYGWSVTLDRALDVLKPSAIFSCGCRDDEFLLAELCRKKHIPAVLISHGSHVRPKNEYERIEWGEHGRGFFNAPFSHLALPSPLSEGYLEVLPSVGKPIKTGPLIWGNPIACEKAPGVFKKLFNGHYSFKEVKVVLHAGTPKSTNGLRLHVYETPDEYIQTLCDLAQAIERMLNTVLVVKFRPTKEISVDDVKTLVPFSEKVFLVVDEPFTDVLGLCDLLVSFSSTTMEEALQNRIPVLLYGGNGRYQHVPAFEIKPERAFQRSAVYHVSRAEDLTYAIGKVLELQSSRDHGQNGKLFDPYIYSTDVCVPLLGSVCEKT